MQDFLAAIGILLVLEGLLYGVFPLAGKRICREIGEAPPDMLRIAGIVMVALGFLLVWLIRG